MPLPVPLPVLGVGAWGEGGGSPGRGTPAGDPFEHGLGSGARPGVPIGQAAGTVNVHWGRDGLVGRQCVGCNVGGRLERLHWLPGGRRGGAGEQWRAVVPRRPLQSSAAGALSSPALRGLDASAAVAVNHWGVAGGGHGRLMPVRVHSRGRLGLGRRWRGGEPRRHWNRTATGRHCQCPQCPRQL